MASRRPYDTDTEDFLKRVEAYDSGQQKSANDIVPRTQLKNKPALSSSIERTKKGSDGSRSMSNEHPSAHGLTTVEGKFQMRESELAFKSAYNYEKTFSPSKTKFSKSDFEFDLSPDLPKAQEVPKAKTYSVSEADYLLLQKLKSGVDGGMKDPHVNVPSRGRPRGQPGFKRELPYSTPSRELPEQRQIPAYLDEESPPSLPTRRNVNNFSNKISGKPLSNSYDETEDSPPLLPVRRAKKEAIDQDEKDTVGSPPYPGLPFRKHKEEQPKNNVNRDLKEEMNQNFNEARQNGVMETRKAIPPPIPPKRQTIRKNLKGNALSEAPPASISLLKTVGSIKKPDPEVESDTIQKDKVAHKAKPDPEVGSNTVQKKKVAQQVKPAHLDYLDSIQKNQPSLQRITLVKNSQLIPSNGKETQPDSFISSAIRSPLSSPSRKKPILPAKPIGLVDKKVIGDCVSESTNEVSEDGEFKSIKLRSIEKTKPEVPAKKSNLITNGRQSLKPSSNNALASSYVTGTKSLKPKPDIPVKLKKVPPKDEHREAAVPEALDKLRKLNKAKTAPPVPSRKVSMPEAFKKVENMRQEKLESQECDDIESGGGSSFKSELGTVFAASKQRLPMASQTNGDHSKQSKKSVASPSGSSEQSQISKSLSHVTKTRSKGPRRKLPSKIQ